ncbi:hypothetical protein GN956_G844 [Arapaima gigas]
MRRAPAVFYHSGSFTVLLPQDIFQHLPDRSSGAVNRGGKDGGEIGAGRSPTPRSSYSTLKWCGESVQKDIAASSSCKLSGHITA